MAGDQTAGGRAERGAGHLLVIVMSNYSVTCHADPFHPLLGLVPATVYESVLTGTDTVKVDTFLCLSHFLF